MKNEDNAVACIIFKEINDRTEPLGILYGKEVAGKYCAQYNSLAESEGELFYKSVKELEPNINNELEFHMEYNIIFDKSTKGNWDLREWDEEPKTYIGKIRPINAFYTDNCFQVEVTCADEEKAKEIALATLADFIAKHKNTRNPSKSITMGCFTTTNKEVDN